MHGDELISRAEVTAMLFTFADINANVERSSAFWRPTMASKRRPKRTPEQRRRWHENQSRLERLIELRLERDRTTRDEIRRRLGLPC